MADQDVQRPAGRTPVPGATEAEIEDLRRHHHAGAKSLRVVRRYGPDGSVRVIDFARPSAGRGGTSDGGARRCCHTGSCATDALASLGIDVVEVRRRADAAFGAGSFQFPRPAFSLSAERAVKASLEQARSVGQERIDTEHLLLGVLADDNDPSLQLLTALNVDIVAVRQTVLRRPAEG